MSDLKKDAYLIFERWQASLKSKDRKAASVGSNFDELFEELRQLGCDFETAHEILPIAIKAHQPNMSIARSTYKLAKGNPKMLKTEQEFIDEWKKSIADSGTESFYAFFELKKKAKASKEDPEDEGPKTFGNMSEREYRLQRRFSDSFPTLDTAALEKRLKEAAYNPEQDLLNVLGEKK